MDQMFYFPGKTILSFDSLNYEEVNLNADSVKLTGVFIKPSAKPKATVLFFHGSGGNVSSYLFMVKPLIKDGYQVFMVDFRGYGKSTGTPTHLNIEKDGQLVFDYLVKRKDVINTKLIVYGASMGTQIAVHLVKNNQDKVTALILDGTISSFTDIAADKSPEAQREMIRKNLLSPYSAKEDIKQIKIPKLFIHSKDDTDVPYSEGQAVYANAPNPKFFYTYTGKHLEALSTDGPAVLSEINKLTGLK